MVGVILVARLVLTMVVHDVGFWCQFYLDWQLVASLGRLKLLLNEVILKQC